MLSLLLHAIISCLCQHASTCFFDFNTTMDLSTLKCFIPRLIQSKLVQISQLNVTTSCGDGIVKHNYNQSETSCIGYSICSGCQSI